MSPRVVDISEFKIGDLAIGRVLCQNFYGIVVQIHESSVDHENFVKIRGGRLTDKECAQLGTIQACCKSSSEKADATELGFWLHYTVRVIPVEPCQAS